ncbi:hypothetical protein L9F63_006849, partial [Diploptera punctata]
MSDSESIHLPSSPDLRKAVKERDKKKRYSSTSSESEKENVKERNKYRESTFEVTESKRELKYREKYYKDPDDVITSRKLRCTSCNSFLQSILLEGRDVYQHPALKVLMCKSCVEFYGDGNLSIDEDGSGKYCRWCAQGGTLYCCSSCCNAFCKKCIKRNLNRSILDDIESDDWKCFVCDGEPLWELRAICKNAHIMSKKIKKKRKEELEKNLKLLKKKKEKESSSRRLNKWQKSTSHLNSSSENDDNSNEDRKKNAKSRKLKRKRNTSSSSDGGKPDKKKKQEDSESDVLVVTECIDLADDDTPNKNKSKKSKDDSIDDSMPVEVDPEGRKEASDYLIRHLKDIVDIGELIAYRAKRLMEKKIVETDFSDPKKVEKVVDSTKLLVKLAGENMEHSIEFLNSQHVHWFKQVKKRSKAKKKLESEREKEEVNLESEREKENVNLESEREKEK